MILDWFKSQKAVDVGSALADQFARDTGLDATTLNAGQIAMGAQKDALQKLLKRSGAEVRALRLNFYKRAKFANSFKWRLIENGMNKETADQITHALAVHLAMVGTGLVRESPETSAPTDQAAHGSVQQLFARGKNLMAEGAYEEAVRVYEELLLIDPKHVIGLNYLGAALSHQGFYKQAEDRFRQAIEIKPGEAGSHSNLGMVLRSRGYYTDAEIALRKAVKLNPTHVEARINLGLTLTTLNRLREARGHFNKVLKSHPHNAYALNGMASLARTEGNLDEADRLARRALEFEPWLPGALESLALTRKMTPEDGEWLRRVEATVERGTAPRDESDLRFALGKYYDDIRDYESAFQNFERANDIQKSLAEPYDRDAHRVFVDEIIRDFTRERLSRIAPGASDSVKPVLVVGMPRSGTSLVEQIIASHPSAKGAGELSFWADTMRGHGIAIGRDSLAESTRRGLTEAYLGAIAHQVGDATRIVDKAPVNSDFLGPINSFFPNARIIYMQRDPIDTCLSCYFQKFILSLNYTMDLGDLAHYYLQHHRLMKHWRTILPAGTLLDVPYAELVADQEGWTRRILDFLGLPWDSRCMDFYKTQRPVATASFWQVRQKMNGDSVARWRNYEKFIGPLLPLGKLDR